MAKVRGSLLDDSAPKSHRRAVVVRQVKDGAVLQAWPRGRGPRRTPFRLYQEEEWALAAHFIDAMTGQERESFEKFAKGVPYTWRDIAMMVMFGSFFNITAPDGTPIVPSREVAQNPQLILDVVTTVNYAMLVREPTGWVALDPGNVGDVLTFRESGPVWLPNNAAAAAELTTGSSRPVWGLATNYLGAPINSLAVTSGAIIAGETYFFPFDVSDPRTFTSIAMRVTTFIAGSQCRMGIYGEDQINGGPGALVVDAGTVATTSNGLKTIPISTTLTPGRYWFAISFSHAIACSLNPNAGAQINIGIDASSSPPLRLNYMRQTRGPSTAMPNPFSGGWTIWQGNFPWIGIR